MHVHESGHREIVGARERLEGFPARCRSAGLKVTQQRTAVYSMLAHTEAHPTPEDVFAAIRPELPLVSLATVYKILDQFHRAGFVRKVSTEGQAARYDAKTDPHHHLVCTSCGAIYDVDLEVEPDLAKTLPVGADFQVARYDVIFHGECSTCRATQSA
jgi:Fur family transcriptional regulator, peroxide stress response regulator